MKKGLLVACLLLSIGFVSAQAYQGKGDSKFQIGANFQTNGTGIVTTYDFGMGENFSMGLQGSYILGVEKTIGADFGDRIDLKARFNANLGSVMNLGEMVDVYPGLDLGLRNFGGHVGMRYFFSDGFGIFSELGFPLAKYKTENLTPAEELNNQVVFSIGASFNLN
ncbi:hypothetical protein SAMN04487911_12214 [Arenibacter nanhaiticus]|uniref:Outer membrane protein beta-barrel domain-containing protein n=1 Tax=Arenibacter nanhaiticus TaxID=558155 RepID=A0A1M6JIN0_9FLAO|nr:DUF6646 family protein [Arenibacter nanhaiticus]SHJ46472.1 hypothetical protein SAMN04487911_12214 [Arenibacter nanhaiticus]